MNTRKYFSSFFIALAAAAIGLFALTPQAWAAAFTSVDTAIDPVGHCGNGNPDVNCNLYDGKQWVWLNGGPGPSGLGAGTYFFAVLVPGGQPTPNDGGAKNLSDDTDPYTNRTFSVDILGNVGYSGSHDFDIANKKIRIGVAPAVVSGGPNYYADTTNNGGVYILAVCSLANGYPVNPNDCKYDAFKVTETICTENCNPQGTNTINACKYYDANADGTSVGDVRLPGWPMTIVPLDGASPQLETQLTSANGCVSWTTLDAGVYTIFEGVPNQSNWFNSDPGPLASLVPPGLLTGPTQEVTLTGPSDEETAVFGNFCVGAGGGLTLGFWSNKNGLAKMNDAPNGVVPELDLLDGLCLANATGNQPNFNGNYTTFRTWILNATATNMAYMLSAQLAAMELNVEAGFVSNVNALVYAPGGCGNTGAGNDFINIGDLMSSAATALCSDQYTPSGDPNRANQECLKNALDAANNNKNFVQANACTATFPTP
jgi:hypothetical protein